MNEMRKLMEAVNQLNEDNTELRQRVMNVCDEYLEGREEVDVDHIYYGPWGDLYGPVMGWENEPHYQEDMGNGSSDKLLRDAYSSVQYEEPTNRIEAQQNNKKFLQSLKRCKSMLLGTQDLY